ncbi:MAG: hypothetical protein IPP44_07970 [Ideonella sp.]|nr:hypothetical protein [Ideonella sp.]
MDALGPVVVSTGYGTRASPSPRSTAASALSKTVVLSEALIMNCRRALVFLPPSRLSPVRRLLE